MGTREVQPFVFSPTSLSDCLDSTHVFAGACARLKNLIPDPSTTNLWQCRPASILKTSFAGFSNPGFISALKVIGSRAYGMIATTRNPTHDEPFCYDIPSGNFITITGVTNPNTPVSPSTSGAWEPPTMALVGRYLIVTHPGFPGTAGVFFGVIDLIDPANPAWMGTNTTGVPLPAVPTAVANFFGRAYFLVNPPNTINPAAYATNPLSLAITASPSQILTFDDNIRLIGAEGLSFKSQLGGVEQALAIFKETNNVYTVMGDFALTNDPIAVNSLNVAISTIAPLTLTRTAKGLSFIAPDGLRIIDREATISDPIGAAGMGVSLPFTAGLVPTREVSACNASVLRITTQNTFAFGTPFEEYWFDFTRKVWSGPHTFAPSLIEPYGNTFIMAPQGVLGSLWQSDVVPSTTSTFVENGVQMQWEMTTSMLPDPGFIGMYSINETTINMALDPTMGSWTANVLNPNSVLYNTVTDTVPNTAPIWDTAIWDTAVWDGVQTGLLPRRIAWTQPLPVSRIQFQFLGQSAGGIRIGDLKLNQGVVNYVPPVGL